jgi:hypothetical protein
MLTGGQDRMGDYNYVELLLNAELVGSNVLPAATAAAAAAVAVLLPCTENEITRPRPTRPIPDMCYSRCSAA